MSLTTTPSRPAVTQVNDKIISSHKPEKIGKPNNMDDLNDVSKIRNVKELTAVMEMLETEEKLIRKLLANNDGKVSISPRAFKEEAISSNTATVVKMLVENKSSNFKQYSDSFYALYYKVSDEYKKWVSEEKTKVNKSVYCVNEQVDVEKSKILELSQESLSSEDSESSESPEESKNSNYLEFTMLDNHDKPPLVCFKLVVDPVEWSNDELKKFYLENSKKIVKIFEYCHYKSKGFLRIRKLYTSMTLNYSYSGL